MFSLSQWFVLKYSGTEVVKYFLLKYFHTQKKKKGRLKNKVLDIDN